MLTWRTSSSSGRAGVWAGGQRGCGAPVAHMHHLPLQQRGERDSQTQAILTKLKCAAGEGPCPGQEGARLTPGHLHYARPVWATPLSPPRPVGPSSPTGPAVAATCPEAGSGAGP